MKTKKAQKFTAKQISEAMELLPTLFIHKYKIKNESGNPIEFEKHKFMWALYNDMSPLQVWLKPPQIGATVAQIIKTLYVAKKKRRSIVYTLPTASDVNDMAGGKINRIVAQNPIFKEWVSDHDTVEQKSVGDNTIYYRGSYTSKSAMMVSSQLNVHDELDASDPTVIEQYETRLQAEADGWRWYFSHPSLAGFGVDIYWQKSDKHEWYITCSNCEKEQILTWPENIDIEREVYICKHCKHELSDEDRIDGEWRATDTGEFRGYHISQMMCSWITASKICKDFREKDPQYFWNMVLGLPYLGSENKINEKDIYKNVIHGLNKQEGTIIIGVDTGLPIHYMLMNRDGVFGYGKCGEPTESYDPYDTLEGLLRRYPESIIVSDQGGDLIGIRKLQAKYPNRVFLVYYRRDRKRAVLADWGDGENLGIVTVDRNRMFQFMVDLLRDGDRIPLWGTVGDYTELAQHFSNVYRVAKETPYGTEYVWERVGPDHYCHTMLYCLVGMDRFAEKYAKIVNEDPLEDIPTASSSFIIG